MSTHSTFIELLNMTPTELNREIRENELRVAKQRLQVQLGSHKDTAGFRTMRRYIARLKTALLQKNLKQPAKAAPAVKKTAKKVLKKTDSDSTLAAPASA